MALSISIEYFLQKSNEFILKLQMLGLYYFLRIHEFKGFMKRFGGFYFFCSSWRC
jgi:hypothetical protein